MHARTTLLLVLLVAFAGCAGASDAGTPTGSASPTPTETPTPTATTQSGTETADPSPSATPPASAPEPTPSPAGTETASYTDCPAVLFLDPVSDVPEDAAVHRYANLSAERRAEFDAAVADETAELEQGGAGYEFWVDRPYVVRDGSVYHAVVAVC